MCRMGVCDPQDTNTSAGLAVKMPDSRTNDQPHNEGIIAMRQTCTATNGHRHCRGNAGHKGTHFWLGILSDGRTLGFYRWEQS